MRHESDGAVSATAAAGFNFHFWSSDGRATVDPLDVGGVFVTVQARLIAGDPQKPDDRRRSRYLLSVGADYWLSKRSTSPPYRPGNSAGTLRR